MQCPPRGHHHLVGRERVAIGIENGDPHVRGSVPGVQQTGRFRGWSSVAPARGSPRGCSLRELPRRSVRSLRLMVFPPEAGVRRWRGRRWPAPRRRRRPRRAATSGWLWPGATCGDAASTGAATLRSPAPRPQRRDAEGLPHVESGDRTGGFSVAFRTARRATWAMCSGRRCAPARICSRQLNPSRLREAHSDRRRAPSAEHRARQSAATGGTFHRARTRTIQPSRSNLSRAPRTSSRAFARAASRRRGRTAPCDDSGRGRRPGATAWPAAPDRRVW